MAIHKTYDGKVASFPIYAGYSPSNKYKPLGEVTQPVKVRQKSCWPSLRKKRGESLFAFLSCALAGKEEEEIHHLEKTPQ